VATVQEFLTTAETPIEVTFCCFSDSDLEIYRKVL
jgi:hypothetical protein